MENNSLLNSLPFQGKEAARGFTLVELIVVITILAILGTIAFISLQGYSKDARDSVRISDISKIKTSLELFQLEAGKYPETTEPTNITYSGAIAWTQGTFGETTYGNVEKLDKIPTDPVTDRKYVYSVTNTKQEYQLAGIMEGDEVTGFLNQTNAVGKTAMVKISGNYNGKVLKVSTGSTDYVLAIPSIITSSGFTLETIVENNYLAYNGYKNLPAQYAGSSYDVLGDSGIELVNKDDLVVYSGDLKTLSSSEPAGITARKNLMEKLKSAYSGTAITGIGEIAQIINTSTEDPTATEFLSTTIVSNNLGGSVAVSTAGGTETTTYSCATQPSYIHATFTEGTPTSVNQEYVKDATNCGYTCIDGYTGTNCEIAPVQDWTLIDANCDIPDIHIPTGCTEGTAGCQVWAGCNSTLGNGIEYSVDQSCYDYIGGTTTGCNRLSNEKEELYNSKGVNNIWGKLYIWSEASKNNGTGPCRNGYKLPSDDDWSTLEQSLGCSSSETTRIAWGCDGLGWKLHNSKTTVDNMVNALKLPLAGNRDTNGVNFVGRGANTYLWSSSPDISNAYNRNMNWNYSTVNRRNYSQAFAFSVRCIKD